MWPAIAAMVALSMAKSAEDQKRYSKQMQLEGAKATYSPWTGIGPGNPQAPDAFGTLMQGAASGIMMGQGFQNAENQQKLLDAQTKYLNAQTNLIQSGLSPANVGTGNLGLPIPPVSGGQIINTPATNYYRGQYWS